MPKEDDLAIQIGLLLGAEWTHEDIATHLGISTGTITNRKKKLHDGDVIERVKGWTKVAISKYIEARLQKAEADLAEKKKRLMEKGYTVIEKTLDHTLIAADMAEKAEVPWKPDAVQLGAANIGIERTEGKPLDRKAILQRDEHVYRLEVDGEDLEHVLRTAAMLNEMRMKALPAGVIDVEAEKGKG